MGLTVAEATQVSGSSLTQNNGSLTFQLAPSLSNMRSLSVNGGELILQNGGTFNDSSVSLSASVFKPTGTVSVTNGGSFNLNDTSSIVLQGDTTLNQAGTVSWPELDLGGKKLSLGSTVGSFSIEKAFTIANGESLSSGSSDVNLSNTLAIDNGGKLSSGSGNLQIIEALTLNGEIEQGGGIVNLIKGGTVGATGRLDVSDSELKLGAALNISGTLAANSASQWSGWAGRVDLSAGTLEAAGGSLSLSDITTGAGTTLKLSADTEITSTSDYTFGTVDLASKKLTLGGNGGLILPNALTMAAGSKIETKTSDLTLSKALQPVSYTHLTLPTSDLE